ncbi:sodium:solute symporter [Pseudomonadota bacterium]
MSFSLNIHVVDSAIVVVYMLAVLAFGLWVGRGQRTSSDYFLGGRSLPWGVLLLSIVATETSTVTFLSLPGIPAAVNGNLTFLQIAIGYIIGRLLIIYVLLPIYFRSENFTAYEVLESRFGKLSRRLTSVLFLFTRNLSDALRLFLTALALQIVLGLDLTISVILLGLITVIYTLVGGAKSVIWNDSIQFIIYMLGAGAAFSIIIANIPGGLPALLQFADETDKFRLFDFDFSLVKPTMTFWSGLVGGAFLTAATHGTDQLMVQRYLSARSQSDAALSLGFSGLIVFLQFAVFLLIGIALAGFYTQRTGPNPLASGSGDQLFAFFIVNYMPVGLAGLTLAAVFAAAMSTLSSSLNSSATALIKDVWLPMRKNGVSQAVQLRAGRIATACFGILQVTIAVLVGTIGTTESTVFNVLKIAGFASGPVLGLFLLAVSAPKVRQPAALMGFIVGVAGLSIIAIGTDLYWPWYAAVGSLITWLAGWLIQLLSPTAGETENGETVAQSSSSDQSGQV